MAAVAVAWLISASDFDRKTPPPPDHATAYAILKPRLCIRMIDAWAGLMMPVPESNLELDEEDAVAGGAGCAWGMGFGACGCAWCGVVCECELEAGGGWPMAHERSLLVGRLKGRYWRDFEFRFSCILMINQEVLDLNPNTK